MAAWPIKVNGRASGWILADTFIRSDIVVPPNWSDQRVSIDAIARQDFLLNRLSRKANMNLLKVEFALKPSVPALGFAFLHYESSPDLEAKNSLRFFSGTIVRRPILWTFK